METDPPADCPLCPRMVELRHTLRIRHPDWHNAPVPSAGDSSARIAIVGLAPGERGANRTGVPFNGDNAGQLLTDALTHTGFWQDGTAQNILITNALRCLPPANHPRPAEVHACRPYLDATLNAMPNLRVVLALGHIAHQSAVKVLGGKLPKHPFAHGAVHRLHTGFAIVDSYHSSQRNQATGLITPDMLVAVLLTAREIAEAG